MGRELEWRLLFFGSSLMIVNGTHAKLGWQGGLKNGDYYGLFIVKKCCLMMIIPFKYPMVTPNVYDLGSLCQHGFVYAKMPGMFISSDRFYLLPIGMGSSF